MRRAAIATAGVAVAAWSFEHWRRVFLVEEPWNEGDAVTVIGGLGLLSLGLAVACEFVEKEDLRRVFLGLVALALACCLPKWGARAWYGWKVGEARAWAEAWAPFLEAERARTGAAPARLPPGHDLGADVPYLIRAYERRGRTWYAVREDGAYAFHVGRATFRGETWVEWSG